MTATLQLWGTHVCMGVLNDHSLSWRITHGLHLAGARVVITYQSKDVRPSIEKLIAGTGIEAHVCDVENDEELNQFFAWLATQGQISGFMYGPAYANRDVLTGRLVDTPRNESMS